MYRAYRSILLRVDGIGLGYPADLAVFEPNLYAPGVIGGRGEDILHDTVGELTVSLVFFEDDGYLQSRVDIFSVLAVHRVKDKRVCLFRPQTLHWVHHRCFDGLEADGQQSDYQRGGAGEGEDVPGDGRSVGIGL